MASPPDSARERAARRIDEVRARFVNGLDERLKGVAELARAAAGPDAKAASDARAALRLSLHNLSGAAPTLGLTELGQRAAEIEARLIAGRLQDGRLDRAVADEIAEAALALGSAIDRG